MAIVSCDSFGGCIENEEILMEIRVGEDEEEKRIGKKKRGYEKK